MAHRIPALHQRKRQLADRQRGDAAAGPGDFRAVLDVSGSCAYSFDLNIDI